MNEEAYEVYRHSASHLMASAIAELYPGVKFAIGPPTREGEKYGGVGFYYDLDMDSALTPEDFPRIEKKMRGLSGRDLPFLREEIGREEAIALFEKADQPYKVEMLRELPEGETITLYRHGDFIDLCRGPHLSSTGEIRAFRLLAVAGAYWRGDEKNKMLQRIYGVAFPDDASLEAYLKRLEEAEKRDHRKLGRELDLFSSDETYGPGLIFWHPRGARIRNEIERYWYDEHFRNGYDVLYTPHLAKQHLWEISGHMDFYADRMYSPMDIDGINYIVKPMNCPFHIHVYKSRLRSYRDLPLRWAELGTVYRYEQSGELHGLKRVRGFTQDDAHLFCTPETLNDEIDRVFRFSIHILNDLGFEAFDVYLSTRPEKSVGSDDDWEKATAALRSALDDSGIPYQVDPGEGVFYGPKIDIKIRDSLGRSWQCSTIQVDFNLPERFDLEYRGADGGAHRPIVIHRALLGSFERFFACLVEHYAGAFPVWLAPEQARVLPVSEKLDAYAREVEDRLVGEGLRATRDASNETLGNRIRKGREERIPYLLIVGEREAEARTVSARDRAGGQTVLPIEEFVQRIRGEIERRETGLAPGEESQSNQ
ncbi:MAG: threonine--tRNA ligase [Candidatus Eisenbacteria bacterium]|nr:threonine--tRNA ligase [Candidatus Eisenbacteria bacterium]